MRYFVDKLREGEETPREEGALHCRDSDQNLIPRQGRPRMWMPGYNPLEEVLGWEPRVPADEGLKTALEWFAERVI